MRRVLRTKGMSTALVGIVLATAPAWGAAQQSDDSKKSVKSEKSDSPADTIESKYQIRIYLKQGRIDKTLPFDVPFLLLGQTDKKDLVGVRAHAFDAPQAFRIEQEGAVFRCVRQGPLRRGRRKPLAEWPTDFNLPPVWTPEPEEATPEPEEKFVCGRLPYIASWSRPETATGEDNADFSLRVPPLVVNRYYVFLFELERKPDQATIQDLEKEMAAVVKASLVETAKDIDVTTVDADDYGAAIKQLQSEVRLRLNRVVHPYVIGGEHEDRSVFEPGAPFDLALRRTLIAALGDAFDVKQQIELCAEKWPELRKALGDKGEEVPGLSEQQAASARALTAGENPCATGELAAGHRKRLLDGICPLTSINGLRPTVLGLATELCDAVKRIKIKEGGPNTREAVQQLRLEAKNELVLLEANSVGAFDTRQTRHFNVDIGVLTAPDLDQAFPYIGTNIYLRPVNKDAPLTGWAPLKRCGVTVGVTLFEKFGETDDRVEPLFSDSALVTGGGCRFNEYARLGGGVLVFRKEDPDPLVDDEELSYSYYLSISIDWDVSDSFSWLRRIFNGLGTSPGG